jgi:tRNA-specific 2-thiouridylase
MNTVPKPKVYVAMSGGVDSSVAAMLLSSRGGKKQANPREFEKLTGRPAPKGFRGYDVTGVFFKPWLSPDGRAFCNWQEDKRDAARVAAKLGIKFKVWDFSKEYGEKVTKYMISSYRNGITPNPDVMCNKEIKFGLFLKKALAEGADFIAMGHYARLGREILNPKSQIPNKSKIRNSKNYKLQTTNYKLLKGVDRNKDQSYFLWTLTQKQLKHCLFPIGDYTKPEVRKLAKKFGLHTHAKKDSQGICFVGQLDVKDFLKGYIKPRLGEIRLLPFYHDRDKMGGGSRIGFDNNSCRAISKIIGYHDGVYYYTIGQRHGLHIKIGGGPYFVAGKDVRKNIIYVTTDEKKLAVKFARVEKINWIDRQPVLPAKVGVKIRYRSKSIPAEISKGTKPGVLIVKFKKPARAVTPGQSAVFYRGEVVLGGGVIV